jgi:acetate kinase
MATKIKNYNSIQEIAENLDKELAETKSVLGDYLRKLDEKRTLAENSKKIREIVMKMAGKKNGNVENLGEIELNGLKIVLDANAFHELTAIEDVVRSQQEHLLVLQKAREALQPLGQLGDTEGLEFIVVENEGIPQRILLKGF